jgi:hypothetical protein
LDSNNRSVRFLQESCFLDRQEDNGIVSCSCYLLQDQPRTGTFYKFCPLVSPLENPLPISPQTLLELTITLLCPLLGPGPCNPEQEIAESQAKEKQSKIE